MPTHQTRLETPLFHCRGRGFGQQWRPAYRCDLLDAAILPDVEIQHHHTLDLLLSRRFRIIWLNPMQQAGFYLH
jgi:hypothetical protein